MLVAPIKRYASPPCCGNPDHVTNFNDRDYTSKMCDGLAGVRDTMRTLFYRKHLNNFRVTSGDKLLGWGEEEDSFERMSLLWGTDPVHLSIAGYKVMAKKIMEDSLSRAAFTSAKEPKRLETWRGRSG